MPVQKDVRTMLCAIAITALAVLPWDTKAYERSATRWTPSDIATDQYESSPTFTPDGREVFFMSSDRDFDHYRILWSRCEAGGWTDPEPPSFAAAPPMLEGDPFVTADGRRLYFISSRGTKAPDDLDIWYVDRKADGGWTLARPLPEPVNSEAAELLPRTDAAGRLYFGSSRPGGLGKGDIYVATPGENDTWRVHNLGPPVNTAAFEYEAEISRDGRTLILVADRGDRSHLYRFALKRDAWVEQDRVPAFAHVFQVGPLLSPAADRLLFAQTDGERSGEIFLIDLVPKADSSWPPRCGAD
jgi:WD40-like Beta Propeller Repeat